MTNPYVRAYRQSIKHPDSFWAMQAEDCHWYQKWEKVLDDGNPPFYRWFSGARTNTCYNALDYHIERGKGNKTALIHASPVTGPARRYSYLRLRYEVALFAGALTAQGVEKGDRVIIYMPMIPQAVIAMLACARIGAIHAVVVSGLTANELAKRMNDVKPKVIVSASCGIGVQRVVPYKPLLDKAIDMAEAKPERCIVFQRPLGMAALKKGRDVDWRDVMASATAHDCVDVAATDPLYILYTIGKTGEPKGVVRDNGGHMVALKWTMKAIYDINEDDVWWTVSDMGWVAGHSYMVYAPLFKGCTTILFENQPVGTPDAGAFWQVISEHRVTAMVAAPAAYRAIRRQDPQGTLIRNYDLSCFKALFLAGEQSDSDIIQWCEKHLNVPVIDHWWQTETGWAITANCMGLHRYDVQYGSPAKAVPGWNLQVLGDDGQPKEPGEIGALAVQLPLPPGTLTTLWSAEDRFIHNYLEAFPDFYMTGDSGYLDRNGYVYLTAPPDDIVHADKHRLSAGAMEEAMALNHTGYGNARTASAANM